MSEYLLIMLQVAIRSFVLWFFLETFFIRKEEKSFFIGGWSIYFGIEFVFIFIDINVIYLNLGITLFIYLIACLISYKAHFSKKIIFCLMFLVTAILMEVLCAYIFMLLTLDPYSLYFIGAFISQLMLLFLVLVLKHLLKNLRIVELPNRDCAVLALIPIGSISLIYNIFYLSTNNSSIRNTIWAIGSSFILLIINIIIFNFYFKLADKLELKRINSIFSQQFELYEKHASQIEKTALEFRNTKHDFKQQLFVLKELAIQNKSEEILNYLNTVMKISNKEKEIIRTGNIIVDSLVNYKYSVAIHYNTTFKVDIQIPIDLPYDSTDICIILGNALDNALEAVVRVKGNERYITLKMKYEKNALLIEVNNSFDGIIALDKFGTLKTIKVDKNNHGIGLFSMKKSAEKYNGLLSYKYTSIKFTLGILLYTKR